MARREPRCCWLKFVVVRSVSVLFLCIYKLYGHMESYWSFAKRQGHADSVSAPIAKSGSFSLKAWRCAGSKSCQERLGDCSDWFHCSELKIDPGAR